MKVKGEGFTSARGKQEAEEILEHHRQVFKELEAIVGACRAFIMSANITGQDTEEEKQTPYWGRSSIYKLFMLQDSI